jgi:hypothetical protein
MVFRFDCVSFMCMLFWGFGIRRLGWMDCGVRLIVGGVLAVEGTGKDGL